MLVPVSFLAEDLPKEPLKFYPAEECRKHKKNLYILTDYIQAFSDETIKACDGVLYNLDGLTPQQVSESIFYIFFLRGDTYLPYLKRIIKEGGKFVAPAKYMRVPHWTNSNCCIEIYNQVACILKAQPKGGAEEFSAIMQAIDATSHLKGDYVEIGVFSGSTALVALLYMQRLNIKRTCYLLDTYSGFRYDQAKKSQDVKWANTHTSWGGFKFSGQNGVNRILNLTRCTGQDVKALEFNACEDNLPASIKNIAMANLDVDMYEATLRGLKLLAPRLVKGGIITTEDACSTYGLPGAYYAVHEFMNSDEGKGFIKLRSFSSYFLVKMN